MNEIIDGQAMVDRVEHAAELLDQVATALRTRRAEVTPGDVHEILTALTPLLRAVTTVVDGAETWLWDSDVRQVLRHDTSDDTEISHHEATSAVWVVTHQSTLVTAHLGHAMTALTAAREHTGHLGLWHTEEAA